MRANKNKKIYDDLIQQIRSGHRISFEVLPSTRDLAKLYRCHRFTVMNVYQILASEGWIESTERSRYIVSDKIPLLELKSIVRLKKRKDISHLINATQSIDLEREKFQIEFWGGQPDLNLFPIDEFRSILAQALRRTKPEQLNYGLTEGIPTCLKEISNYLRRSRSLLNKEFIMTNGSQEALYLIFKTFVKPGEKIAVERKGYLPAWRLFESLGAEIIPIEIDQDGLDTSDLQKKIKKHKIKLIYITPLHQYPTTVTLSPRRRQHLIQIAESNQIPILEDDYDNEFHYTAAPPNPISTETDYGIYVCSFSKILFPGARLGVIGCNADIKTSLCTHKYLISRQTDSLVQIGLTAWIREGGFERHLRRMRRIYEQRYLFMLNELTEIKKQKNINWKNPNGGMSIWVNLNQDSKKISDLAKKQGVFFQYESSMDYLNSKGTHLRIGFAGVNENQIKEGLQILTNLLK